MLMRFWKAEYHLTPEISGKHWPIVRYTIKYERKRKANEQKKGGTCYKKTL